MRNGKSAGQSEPYQTRYQLFAGVSGSQTQAKDLQSKIKLYDLGGTLVALG